MGSTLSIERTVNGLRPSAAQVVDEQVTQLGYGTNSAYVRELIRKELDRTNLRALLQEGAASPVVGELDAPYFNSLRERANARAAK